MQVKKRRKSLIKAYQTVIALCLILLMIQALYADTEAVQKQPRPEKELKVGKQAGPKKEEKKAEKKNQYVYNPAGKLDPFESFLTEPGTGGRGSTSLTATDLELQGTEAIISKKEPETELEKIEISKLTLTSVIKGKSKVWAMVVDPKGRGYFLKKGTKIGTHNGVVDEIIIEQKQTPFGAEIVRKVIIKVPYRDRNRKIIFRSIEMEMPYATL
ncbi:MAG: pilus assembly protein PilP [Deltaproteobacteria bacterium]|nr:pilus assembly protein PilP [Deltaproteobacteria bacterium]